MNYDTLFLFRILAPFAILAGCILALPMYALHMAELDVQADKIIIAQKSEEAEIAVEVMERKGRLGQPKPKKIKRRKVK